ncbi:MAG: BAX inhibitor (BI)-1/YccA family protein [SAR324 cluster bacterium]|uniref:BAX inhibitor (BI)-1/YccA family protein n=3 Tax=SAR324 cluster bacterium TaxID=2024889 RepID=A0A432GHH5_9DELT|nr:MAG: BAX inhibitor (BI)-1/YccA family protein [SAR324 cluster bacterium]RTZ84786.1 MAG: BAX inhibitor (BI)-1/YccA family protein [SAR324 cluster bacterium]HIB16428.1 Bax inhibitor-1/YccA family protein [Candidatus Lambdaproteobacteria bacterium]HIC06413.1 Bax inhibitor-1/YccA family protein [Candidatus Lambdaproteobacteria bacterium]HIN01366.1 Bax inhibitor-1/YccA family protein [Deltaproteobacteria bacterium]
MRFGSTTTLPRGVTPAASVTTTDRLVFIKKVYSLLAMSMGTAAIGAYLGSGPLLLLVAPNMMLFFILQIALIFFASFAARKPGLNMVALFSFTTVSGLTLGPLLYQVGPSIAAEAFALTAITFAGLSMYVVYSKKDFSFMSGFLMTGLIVLVVGGLLNMFFIQSGMMHFVMSGASVLLFSGFILYDTSNILRYYGTDEYVSATLALYLDVLNLFIALLSILGIMSDE